MVENIMYIVLETYTTNYKVEKPNFVEVLWIGYWEHKTLLNTIFPGSKMAENITISETLKC